MKKFLCLMGTFAVIVLFAVGAAAQSHQVVCHTTCAPPTCFPRYDGQGRVVGQTCTPGPCTTICN